MMSLKTNVLQVGFISYSNTLQFYNLKVSCRPRVSSQTTLAQPQMMVVGELDEVFLPAPNDLLVNLQVLWCCLMLSGAAVVVLTVQEGHELVKQLMAALPTLVSAQPPRCRDFTHQCDSTSYISRSCSSLPLSLTVQPAGLSRASPDGRA